MPQFINGAVTTRLVLFSCVHIEQAFFSWWNQPPSRVGYLWADQCSFRKRNKPLDGVINEKHNRIHLRVETSYCLEK